jgi:Uncharacterized conserved protein
MSQRFAWIWNVKPECLDEYVKMHLNAWPDMMEEHSKAGIRNYSIFQNGNQFFYVFECDSQEAADRAFACLADSEVCQRWNAITSKMVEGSFDFSKPTPVKYLREVFYLK